MENLPKWKEVFSLSNFILLVLYQSLIFSKDGFSGLAYSLAYRKASMEKIKKILLIDDEESTLRAFENVLLLNGFDCFATSDIELGICTYQKYEFDCVLLDYQMPCKNGIEVMSDILCLNHNAKVIIYTGQTDISIKRQWHLWPRWRLLKELW